MTDRKLAQNCAYEQRLVLPWRTFLVIGGALLTLLAAMSLWIVPTRGWLIFTMLLIVLGVVLLLAGLVALWLKRRHASQGLEPARGAGGWLPLVALPLMMAFILSLVSLPPSYSLWVNGLFVALLALAVWLGWRFLRSAAPLGYRQAQRAYQEGDLDTALRLLQTVEKERPDFYGTYHLKALIQREHRNYVGARESSLRLIALRPDLYYGYGELGLTLLREGKADEACRALRQAAQIAPGLPESHLNLGMACAEAQDYEGAVAALSQALRLGLPDRVTQLIAHYYLLRSFEALDCREQAQAEGRRLKRYQKVLELWRRELNDGHGWGPSHATMNRRQEQALLVAIERVMQKSDIPMP